MPEWCAAAGTEERRLVGLGMSEESSSGPERGWCSIVGVPGSDIASVICDMVSK